MRAFVCLFVRVCFLCVCVRACFPLLLQPKGRDGKKWACTDGGGGDDSDDDDDDDALAEQQCSLAVAPPPSLPLPPLPCVYRLSSVTGILGWIIRITLLLLKNTRS